MRATNNMAKVWRYGGFLLIPLFIIAAIWGASSLKAHLDPNTHKSDEASEDAKWIATSKYWLDRNACRYLSICGLAHYHPDPAGVPWRGKLRSFVDASQQRTQIEENAESEGWEDIPRERLRPEDFAGDKKGRVLKDVPQFVLDAAPLIHLYSKEEFWPSHLSEHLKHTSPFKNHTAVQTNSSYTVHNLHKLNQGEKGKYLFMRSDEDVELRPEWLASKENRPVPFEDEEDDEEEDDEEEGELSELKEMDTNKPDVREWFDVPHIPDVSSSLPTSPVPAPREELRRRRRQSRDGQTPIAKPDESGRSPAPVYLIMVDKGHGIIDAFWFYFYSYNLGTTVLNVRYGNHVGDWEHSLIRFHDGVPKAVFFSAHSGGTAFSYASVEKYKPKKGKTGNAEKPRWGGRPVLYSAMGSHAMYAMPGTHPYVLPFGILADVTDKGPLWDPALNYIAYHYTTPITHDVDARLAPEPMLETHLNQRPDSLLPASLYMPEESISIDDVEGKGQDRRGSTLVPAACNPDAPTSWFWFNGHWGDKFYELGDERQWRFVGQYHYVNGPLGPRYKNLGRSKVCQSGLTCRILDTVDEGQSWVGK